MSPLSSHDSIRLRRLAVLGLLGGALLLPGLSPAQTSDSDRVRPGAAGPRAITLAPVLEGGLRKNRGINIPINLRLDPARELVVGYTASNSYSNPGVLACYDFSCQLSYESDHIGNLYFMSYTQPVLERFEIAFTLGNYRMSEPPEIANALISDRSLRRFHDNVLSEDSLPALSGAPDGRQRFAMTDHEGRSLTLRPDHSYALPLRVDVTRYLHLKRGPSVRMGLNVGLHLAYPLEGDLDAGSNEFAFSRGLDVGVSLNLIRVRQLTENLSATFNLQVARFRSDVTVVNPRSPVNSDDRHRSQYALTYGLRFERTFNGSAPCSFGLSHVSSSAHYDKQAHYAYDPVVFQGGNNLRGALAGANDFGAIHFGCEYRQRHYQLSLVEDIAGFSQFVGDDGAGTSYDPDFTVAVSATWVLSRRSAR